MAKQNIGNRTTTFYASDAGTTYVLAQGNTITSSEAGIKVTGFGEDRTVIVNGRIDSKAAAVQLGDNFGSLAPAEVHVGKTGVIESDAAGISLWGTGHLAVNAGAITAQYGVMANGAESRIVNTGSIDASVGGIFGGAGQTVVNTGTISGLHGIYMTGNYGAEGVTIRNSGSVTGEYTALYGSANGDSVVNTGTISGLVMLGDGSDFFAMKAGKLTGSVDGGKGDDVYVIRVKGVDIHESMSSGFDTVKSSVTYTLGNEIEKLVLTGKGDIGGIGGMTANEIVGNAGNNLLRGGGGDDTLAGGRGRDQLHGEAGADIFVFATGNGRDTIMDYADELDRIDISDLRAVGSFADLMKNHVSEHGADVWITAGDDVLILKNTSASALDMGDFIW